VAATKLAAGLEPRLVLLLPVYQGGEMFKRCLQSVRAAQHLFDIIVISLNGEEAAEDLSAIEQSGIDPNVVKVLKPQRLLAPARHISWATQELRDVVNRSDHVLLLAHDDELHTAGLKKWKEARPSNWNKHAWIGDYWVIDDSMAGLPAARTDALPQSIDAPIDLVEWLAVNTESRPRHVFTNMSGLSIPYCTLRRVARFISATKMNKGYRFEYLLVASRTNAAINRRSPPAVIVHLHSGQGGRAGAQSQMLMDEARYCLWLLLNAKSVREFDHVLRSYWGPRRLVTSVLKATYGSVASWGWRTHALN
jgi:hypothetical protein